jgi:hypothetical protein
LIDEVFGINNGLVDLDPELVGKAEEASKKGIKKIKTPLNSNDKYGAHRTRTPPHHTHRTQSTHSTLARELRLFAFLRDVNFGVLGPLLNKKAKEIDEYYKVGLPISSCMSCGQPRMTNAHACVCVCVCGCRNDTTSRRYRKSATS